VKVILVSNRLFKQVYWLVVTNPARPTSLNFQKNFWKLSTEKLRNQKSNSRSCCQKNSNPGRLPKKSLKICRRKTRIRNRIFNFFEKNCGLQKLGVKKRHRSGRLDRAYAERHPSAEPPSPWGHSSPPCSAATVREFCPRTESDLTPTASARVRRLDCRGDVC
jgi:hypothetical protein